MKYLLILITIMLVGGCGKGNQTADESPKANPVKELTAEQKKIVGSYENKSQIDEKYTIKLVLLENGNGETYWHGEKGDGKWKIAGNEVHFVFDGNYSTVYIIEPDGDLKLISEIGKGKRLDFQNEDQLIYKKSNN